MMNELCLFDRLLEDEQQSQSSLLDETAWVSTEGAGTSEDILDSTLTQCGIKESTNIDMDVSASTRHCTFRKYKRHKKVQRPAFGRGARFTCYVNGGNTYYDAQV